jgi:hypothetical protein
MDNKPAVAELFSLCVSYPYPIRLPVPTPLLGCFDRVAGGDWLDASRNQLKGLPLPGVQSLSV